jgi:hypothetical protein
MEPVIVENIIRMVSEINIAERRKNKALQKLLQHIRHHMYCLKWLKSIGIKDPIKISWSKEMRYYRWCFTAPGWTHYVDRPLHHAQHLVDGERIDYDYINYSFRLDGVDG